MKNLLIITILIVQNTFAQVAESVRVFSGHNNIPLSIAFSPDGERLVSGIGGSDYSVKLWNVNTGACLNTFIGHASPVKSVVYSPKGDCVASGSWDRTIKIWDIKTGAIITTCKGHTGAITSLVFTSDGEKIISASDDETLKLWDVKTGQVITTFTGHTNIIESATISPYDKYIASGSRDNTIKIWNINSGICLKTFVTKAPVTSVAFSPDGMYIVSGSKDNDIRLWYLDDSSSLRTFKGHTDEVVSVMFSPDGNQIVSGSADETIKIWDTKTGSCLKTFVQNTGMLYDAVISPDGQSVASSCGDNTIILWDISKFVALPAGFEMQVKKYVENKINTWQIKGEFEKTADFQSRVNDNTRKLKVEELTKICIDSLKEIESKKITEKIFKLNKYDPDNETYLVEDYKMGKFPLPVPVADAQSVKANWESSKIINPDFYIENGHFKLSKFSISCNGKIYTYDSKIPTTYAVNNITYSFSPIDVSIPNTSQQAPNIITANVLVGTSDVDLNIPSTIANNDKTFVVIVANENYADEVRVDYAINDGLVFKQYCEKTLGIPAMNVHFVKDATYGKLISEKGWLTNNLKAYKGDAKAIFYYAGHGIPGGEDKPAYLLPVDGSSMDITSALMLDDLYTTLTQNPSNGVTVFIDACFSGSTRDAGMLASARGTKLKPRESTLPGNLVVFSAASGDETAWPYKDKQHGMFTYYLLKKLQETKGDVSYKDLADYINDNVYKTSIRLNNKPQTSTIKAGAEALGWENRKLN